MPLPVGLSTPSSKSGWWSSGLAWLQGGVGQVQADRPAVLAEPGYVALVVAARLVGQRLQHDVEREAAEGLGLQLAGVDDAARQAGVLRCVLRQQPQLLGAELAEADDVVAVLVEEDPGVVGEPRQVGEERVQLLLTLLERAGGLDGVAQDRRDLGHHVGVDRGHAGREPEVLDDGGDLRVEALEVGVDGLEVLADQLAAPLEGGGDGVERQVDVGRLHRAQQRVEVVEHLLDLDGDLGPLDRGAGLDVVRRRARRAPRARRTSRRTGSWARSSPSRWPGSVSTSSG